MPLITFLSYTHVNKETDAPLYTLHELAKVTTHSYSLHHNTEPNNVLIKKNDTERTDSPFCPFRPSTPVVPYKREAKSNVFRNDCLSNSASKQLPPLRGVECYKVMKCRTLTPWLPCGPWGPWEPGGPCEKANGSNQKKSMQRMITFMKLKFKGTNEEKVLNVKLTVFV